MNFATDEEARQAIGRYNGTILRGRNLALELMPSTNPRERSRSRSPVNNQIILLNKENRSPPKQIISLPGS